MKLAVLLAALCASCTAITLAPERPKPQLQRANKALALRGGGLAQDLCKSKFPAGSTGLFKDCFKASDGLLIVFLWGALYALGALPDPIGKWMQENVFSKIYISDGKRMPRRARTPDWLVTLDSLDDSLLLTPFEPCLGQSHTSAGRSYSFWARLQTPQSSCLPSTTACAFAGVPPSGGQPLSLPSPSSTLSTRRGGSTMGHTSERKSSTSSSLCRAGTACISRCSDRVGRKGKPRSQASATLPRDHGCQTLSSLLSGA